MNYFIKISSHLFAVITFALCVNCNGNSNNKYEDSVRMADSIANVRAEEERLEAARQDSIARVESERYDKMLSECEAAMNLSNKYILKVKNQMFDENYDPDNYEKARVSYEKYEKKYKEILKVIDNFTPEQFERVQKMEKKIISPVGILWG